MTSRNEELANILHAIAGMYRLIGNNTFRAIAYQNASNAISALAEDVSEYVKNNSLDEIPAIGKSIAADITEFVRKGHIRRFEKLKKLTPYELVELMDINGFGPQSIKALHKQLVAANTGTALEINCQPNRLDVNDELAFHARELGVKLVVSTDSHSLRDFSYMSLGVSVARRAWCTRDDILNTLSWKEIEKHFRKKRQRARAAATLTRRIEV